VLSSAVEQQTRIQNREAARNTHHTQHITHTAKVENVKTNLLIQMEILGRWLASIVVIIAIGAFLLAFLHAKESFSHAFESAVAIAGACAAGGGRTAADRVWHLAFTRSLNPHPALEQTSSPLQTPTL